MVCAPGAYSKRVVLFSYHGLAQTDRLVSLNLNIVMSRRVSFGFVNASFFFLKGVSTIDLHYFTDRLQWFELKISVTD